MSDHRPGAETILELVGHADALVLDTAAAGRWHAPPGTTVVLFERSHDLDRLRLRLSRLGHARVIVVVPANRPELTELLRRHKAIAVCWPGSIRRLAADLRRCLEGSDETVVVSSHRLAGQLRDELARHPRSNAPGARHDEATRVEPFATDLLRRAQRDDPTPIEPFTKQEAGRPSAPQPSQPKRVESYIERLAALVRDQPSRPPMPPMREDDFEDMATAVRDSESSPSVRAPGAIEPAPLSVRGSACFASGPDSLTETSPWSALDSDQLELIDVSEEPLGQGPHLVERAPVEPPRAPRVWAPVAPRAPAPRPRPRVQAPQRPRVQARRSLPLRPPPPPTYGAPPEPARAPEAPAPPPPKRRWLMPVWVPAAIILLTGLSGLAAAYWADQGATRLVSPPAAAPAAAPSMELGLPVVTPVREGSGTSLGAPGAVSEAAAAADSTAP